MLVGVITLQVNGSLQTSSEVNVQSNTSITALNIAESILSEIRNKRWDNILNAAPGNMTAPSSLGPLGGGTFDWTRMTSTYDDMNDFNNLSGTVTVNGVGYLVKVKIIYITATDFNNPQSVATNYKKITVSVKSTLLAIPTNQNRIDELFVSSPTSGTIVLNYIATYQRLFNQTQIN
jgi:hypothetical protein